MTNAGKNTVEPSKNNVATQVSHSTTSTAHSSTKKTLSLFMMQGKQKRSLGYDLRIREAMEIRQHNSGPGKGLNEDMEAYVKTDMWDPVLGDIT